MDKKYMVFTEHDHEELYDLKKNSLETTHLVLLPEKREQLEKVRERFLKLKQRAE